MERIRCNQFRAVGYPIGSGTVESSAKAENDRTEPFCDRLHGDCFLGIGMFTMSNTVR